VRGGKRERERGGRKAKEGESERVGEREREAEKRKEIKRERERVTLWYFVARQTRIRNSLSLGQYLRHHPGPFRGATPGILEGRLTCVRFGVRFQVQFAFKSKRGQILPLAPNITHLSENQSHTTG
jgi:hypothetical protein